MRERLREVADEALEARVVLLREQAEVVAEREQALEHLARLVELAEQDEVVHEPEGAEEERALSRRQPVDVLDLLVVAVALHEPVDEQLPADGLERAAHARVVGR